MGGQRGLKGTTVYADMAEGTLLSTSRDAAAKTQFVDQILLGKFRYIPVKWTAIVCQMWNWPTTTYSLAYNVFLDQEIPIEIAAAF